MPDLDDPMLGLKEAAQASPGQSEERASPWVIARNITEPQRGRDNK